MNPKYFDIHAHLNFSAFDIDRDETAKRALDVGVHMINVGTQQDTSKSAVELAEKYESGMYAAIGLHPVHTGKSYHDEAELGEGGKAFTSRGEKFDFVFYEELAKHEKVVAIGECGLDFYRVENNELGIKKDEIIQKQEEAFRAQIELAIKVDKPLILHIRNAYKEAHEILNSYFLTHNSRLRGDVHFFAGTIEEARLFLDMGFSLSFTGVITFAKNYEELVRFVPLDRTMSETDCPYVSPAPFRGKRNEPLYVQEVVKKIALIKGEDFEDVRSALVQNAQTFFRLS